MTQTIQTEDRGMEESEQGWAISQKVLQTLWDTGCVQEAWLRRVELDKLPGGDKWYLTVKMKHGSVAVLHKAHGGVRYWKDLNTAVDHVRRMKGGGFDQPYDAQRWPSLHITFTDTEVINEQEE